MSRGKHGVCFLNSFSSSNHCINAAFYLFTFFITAICKHECFSEGNVCGFFLCVLFVSFFFSHLGCSLFIYLNGACQNNPSLTKSSEDVCRRVASALLPEELSFHPLLGSQLPWPWRGTVRAWQAQDTEGGLMFTIRALCCVVL